MLDPLGVGPTTATDHTSTSASPTLRKSRAGQDAHLVVELPYEPGVLGAGPSRLMSLPQDPSHPQYSDTNDRRAHLPGTPTNQQPGAFLPSSRLGNHF